MQPVEAPHACGGLDVRSLVASGSSSGWPILTPYSPVSRKLRPILFSVSPEGARSAAVRQLYLHFTISLGLTKWMCRHPLGPPSRVEASDGGSEGMVQGANATLSRNMAFMATSSLRAMAIRMVLVALPAALIRARISLQLGTRREACMAAM